MAVYFVQDSRTCEIKIGYADDPGGRVAALQTGNPGQLITLLILPGDRSHEAQLHRRFAAARGVGEWFRPVPELLGFILDAVRSLTSADVHTIAWGNGWRAGREDVLENIPTGWVRPDPYWGGDIAPDQIGPSLLVCCPACGDGFDYNHPGDAVAFPFGGKWSGRAIEMSCETGHNWLLCVGNHKGQSFMFAVPGAPEGEDLEPAVATTG